MRTVEIYQKLSHVKRLDELSEMLVKKLIFPLRSGYHELSTRISLRSATSRNEVRHRKREPNLVHVLYLQ